MVKKLFYSEFELYIFPSSIKIFQKHFLIVIINFNYLFYSENYISIG